jgi:Concanavalin A-like lectin/glucanases superfamily/Carboxypeptidase regulatory-like domain
MEKIMMKTITKHAKFYFLLFTFTFLLFNLNGFAQTCSPAPIGLVSWWQGENDALDSRSRNNGTLQNGATFASGNIGQSFDLDGVNDSVSIPDSPTLRSTNLTIEGWFRFDSVTGSVKFLVSKAASSSQSYLVRYAPTDPLQLTFQTGNTGPGSGQNSPVGVNFVPTLGLWNHLAFTFDDVANIQSIYINGALVASNSATNSISYTVDPLRLGSNPLGTSLFFDGGIDEISIYDRTLSVSEIQTIFNAGTVGKCKPTATVSPSGQVGWWSGDGSANDMAGTNNGTLQSGAGFAVGKVGQAFQFDNTANQAVSVPDSAALDLTNAVTIETWVSPQQVGGAGNNSTFVFKGSINSFSTQSYGLAYFSDGAISFRIGNSSTIQEVFGGIVLPLNTFSHVVGTYDGTTIKIYVNGVLRNSAASSIGTLVNTPDPLKIGSNGFGPFFGKVDEVSIYNRAITQDEVTSIFNAGITGKLKQNATINSSSLVSLWQGEGNANDTRGANNGVFAANTYAPGKVGQAFSLNGSNDSVNMGSVQSTQLFSLEAWVKPLSAVNDSINQELIVGDGVASIVVRKISGVDRPVFQYRDSTGNTFQQVIGTTGIPLNTFTHFAGTYDGATLRLYVNGVLDNQSTPTNATVFSCNSPYFIGGFPAGTYCSVVTPAFQFFNGVIDETAIYNRALSPTEVRANYEAGNALSTVVGDARITFPTVSTAGTTQQIPLDLSTLPSLPSGSTTTGLTYDIATTAVFTGSPQVCFNLSSITNSTIFSNLRILHLENNAWINRTNLASINFATKTVCTSGLTSLSPFAVVNGFAATAANASISGQVTTANGNGIRNVLLQLTNSATGETVFARTGSFGFYKFENLQTGQTYVLNVFAKKYQFTNPSRVISLNEDLTAEDFVSENQ